jgi:hypothetical protein
MPLISGAAKILRMNAGPAEPGFVGIARLERNLDGWLAVKPMRLGGPRPVDLTHDKGREFTVYPAEIRVLPAIWPEAQKWQIGRRGSRHGATRFAAGLLPEMLPDLSPADKAGLQPQTQLSKFNDLCKIWSG